MVVEPRGVGPLGGHYLLLSPSARVGAAVAYVADHLRW
jgi:hypothetical protein